MSRRFLAIAGLALILGCAAVPSGVVVHAPPTCPSSAVAILPPNQGNVTTLQVPLAGLIDLALDDQGNLYALQADALRRLGPDGQLAILAHCESYAPPFGSRQADAIADPHAIAVAHDGTVYVTGMNNLVYKLPPGGTLSSQAIPERWAQPIAGEYPGLAVDSHNNVYVAVGSPLSFGSDDRGDNVIDKITPDGQISRFAGQTGHGIGYVDGPALQAKFFVPGHLAFDSADNLYVADRGNLSIRRITPDGVVSTVAGHGYPSIPPSPPAGQPQPDLSPLFVGSIHVVGLTVDRAGNLYYTADDNRIYQVSTDGQSRVFAGDGKICRIYPCYASCAPIDPTLCDRDGPPTSAEFNQPSTIVANADGVLYVLATDTEGRRKVRLVR